MTEFTGIAYEPHPVSPERKAELRAQGLRIIDIQFQPAPTAEEIAEREQAEAEAKAAELAFLAHLDAEAARLESERIAAEEALAAAERAAAEAEAERLAKAEADRVESERLAVEPVQIVVQVVAEQEEAPAKRGRKPKAE